GVRHPEPVRLDGVVWVGAQRRDGLHVRRRHDRRRPHARSRKRRLHPVLGLQPEHRATRSRDGDREGAQARRAADRRRSTPRRPLACRPAFDLIAENCRRFSPDVVAATCWIEREQVERAARMLWESRPTAYYSWSGVEQQSSATQIARAISLLYALTGCFDAPGGNVIFPSVPASNVAGEELLSSRQRGRALGLSERPLGPARTQWVTTAELYRAILDEQPYAVRGLV